MTTNIETVLKDAPAPRETIFTPEYLRGWLEYHGWTRAVAGDADFDAAVHALAAVQQTERHGLYVTGPYGCGKTSLLRTITGGKAFWVDLGNPYDLEKLTEDWQRYHVVNPFLRNVVLDDLGAENMKNEYGVKINLVGDFISLYHLFGKRRLYISTNLNVNELDESYGGRVRSRLRDLCVPLKMTGKDKREWLTGAKEG